MDGFSESRMDLWIVPARLLRRGRRSAQLTKVALASAVSRGTIGRRDMVMIGDFHEMAALEPRDLLAFFGATEIKRFTLSREDYPDCAHRQISLPCMPCPTL
jgi:hypothetical protein